MEPFEIACPHCSGKLRVATPSLLGRTVKCPKCTNPFTVPSEEDLAGTEEDQGVIEQNVEVGSGVGSGVGSSLGVGNTVGIGSGVGASLGRLGRGYDDDYEEKGEEPSDVAEIPAAEEPKPAKPAPAPSTPRRSEKPTSRRPQQPFPAQNLAMILGIPAAILFFGALLILFSKGYLTPGGKDHRQDGSRFVDFARDAEKNAKWVPQPDHRYRPGKWNNE